MQFYLVTSEDGVRHVRSHCQNRFYVELLQLLNVCRTLQSTYEQATHTTLRGNHAIYAGAMSTILRGVSLHILSFFIIIKNNMQHNPN